MRNSIYSLTDGQAELNRVRSGGPSSFRGDEESHVHPLTKSLKRNKGSSYKSIIFRSYLGSLNHYSQTQDVILHVMQIYHMSKSQKKKTSHRLLNLSFCQSFPLKVVRNWLCRFPAGNFPHQSVCCCFGVWRHTPSRMDDEGWWRCECGQIRVQVFSHTHLCL